MKKFKRLMDHGFFIQGIRLTRLSHLGGLQEKLKAGIDFKIFLAENQAKKSQSEPDGHHNTIQVNIDTPVSSILSLNHYIKIETLVFFAALTYKPEAKPF